jgi:hypothetical protein
MRRCLLVLLVAGALAGCGSEEAGLPIERDTPAITSPDTDIPYEAGGGDGSGADGNAGDVDEEPRGGVAAGPDNSDERK